MKCQIHGCARLASHSIAWRSNFMDASAFWYHCHPCTLETLVQFNHANGRIVYETHPLDVSIPDA